MKVHQIPIKVLFISHSAKLYGAEKSLLLLLKEIDKNRFDPIVAIPGEGSLKEEVRQLNIRTHRIQCPHWVGDKTGIVRFLNNAFREIITSFKLYGFIKREGIDLIYTNTMVNLSGALAAFIAGKPHIWHIREILSGNPDLYSFLPHKALFNIILRLSHKIIANSNAVAKQFHGSSYSRKMTVVNNAVESLAGSREVSFPEDIAGALLSDWLVVMIGALQKTKAQDDAIHAVKITSATIPNIKLMLIGDGREDYKEYLKELVLELEISDKIIFTGYRNDVRNILPYCKILLMPSMKESFGRAALEAMAAGIPVIAANTGGLKEVVRDGVTGYFVPPGNYSAIAERIVDLYRHPDRAKRMGNEGKRVAEKEFNVGKYVQNIGEIMEESINSFLAERNEK